MPRIAHLADTHLGARQYQRATRTGMNARETDISLAFEAAVTAIIAAKPDLIVHGGDFFHEPKPSNHALRFAIRQLTRLRDKLPGVPVVIVAGNHDSARTVDTGAILPLFEELGLAHVAQAESRVCTFPALDLRVVGAPHQAVMLGEIPLPEGPERYQVLVAHAEVSGQYGGERPCGQLAAEVLGAGWSYVALGDYHIAHEVGPMMWYPGSAEFTSSNPWAELETPKGWLLVDLDAGTVEPQPIPHCRRFYDLPEINAADMTSAEVDAAIAERVNAVEITGAVARLKVVNIPRGVSRALDHAAVRRIKGQALHFQLDFKQPDVIHVEGQAPQHIREPLDAKVARHLSTCDITPGINRERLVAEGRKLMAEAEQEEQKRMARKAG